MRAMHFALVIALALGACAGDDKPAGPPVHTCAYDGGMATTFDLGVPSDLGPLVAPDIQDGAMPPSIPDLGPDFVLGCPKLRFCTTGDPTGLTWNNFARPFFAAYCTRCHSSTLTGADRHGAPGGRDWDDRSKVMADLPLIRQYVGVQMYMPFDQPWVLPCDRRAQLVSWIDEGAP